MAEAMGMTVLIVPEVLAPALRRYIANNGRTYTTQAGKAGITPMTSEPYGPEHAQEEI
jgi:hypothetical protein